MRKAGWLNQAKKRARNEEGYILALSVMLVMLLGISGASFFQLDYLERRMVMNEVANHDAFYLANSGVERARENFKIPIVNDIPSWTTVLTGGDPSYPVDNTPDPLLCPDAANRGCVIPPFQTAAANTNITADGDPVTAPDLPFSGTFDAGSYEVRAYNNIEGGSGSTTDNDGILVFRAKGDVRGQQKVIEVQVRAVSGLNLINCRDDDPSTPCPDSANNNMTVEHMDGRDPASLSELPVWNRDFYRDTSKLPCSVTVDLTGPVTLVEDPATQPNEVQIHDNHCYHSTGSITVGSIGNGNNNIAIYSDQTLTLGGDAEFTNTILIGESSVQLQGNITTHAPGIYPAVISGGDLVKGDASVEIYGNIFAEGAIGSDQHPWNPNEVHGTIIGEDVYLKAASTLVTDDGNILYYSFMPGFAYPDEIKTTVTLGDTWREIK